MMDISIVQWTKSFNKKRRKSVTMRTGQPRTKCLHTLEEEGPAHMTIFDAINKIKGMTARPITSEQSHTFKLYSVKHLPRKIQTDYCVLNEVKTETVWDSLHASIYNQKKNYKKKRVIITKEALNSSLDN